MTESTKGIKNDAEKNRLELLSPLWLMGVGRVLTFGAKKYSAHNWRKGLEISRLLGACLRHVLAFLGGEDNDPETGLLHLYHASCCLMFASELYTTKPQLDDRYKPMESVTDLFNQGMDKILKDLANVPAPQLRRCEVCQEDFYSTRLEMRCQLHQGPRACAHTDGLMECKQCERTRIEFGRGL